MLSETVSKKKFLLEERCVKGNFLSYTKLLGVVFWGGEPLNILFYTGSFSCLGVGASTAEHSFAGLCE